MSTNTPSNIFESLRLITWNAYAHHLDGSKNGAFLVISSSLLKTQAQNALNKSAEAFGYGLSNVTYLTLTPHALTDEASLQEKPATESLDPKEIFRVVESLDPLCVVITDNKATQAVAAAFHIQLKTEESNTMLGHNCCCFTDFERMISQETSKHRAWHLLKTLPPLTQ